MKCIVKIALTIMMVGSLFAHGQDKSMQLLPLNDMSSFRPQAGNWQIVGDVQMNPWIDVSHVEPVTAVTTSKGKSKKNDKAMSSSKPERAVTIKPGTGILLNMNEEGKNDNLLTVFEHGDIELELEVMLPKGSNSGIYLQGRYEVQLFDSWGVKYPKFSDIGGIYRNWETAPDKIYMGKAPLSNPSKAPGLWQHLKISFSAPKFDASGKKVSNAKFNSVVLNGVEIHANVEVPQLTGGAIANNEASMGPIMIQGDHGAVAIRNFKYQLLGENKITLSDINYKYYKGTFDEIAPFAKDPKPASAGKIPMLTAEIIEDENNYGVVYSGTINVPQDDHYTFVLGSTGGVVVTVNNQTIIDLQRQDWRYHVGTIELKKGAYPLVIYNFKTSGWMPPRLSLSVRTPTMGAKNFQTFGSYPPSSNPTSPIFVDPTDGPRLLRAFVDFKGNEAQRLTHSIGVGEPSGINYVYDLATGTISCVWRGNFVDATPMWNDRGDGSFKPRGATQFTYKSQSLAYLTSAKETFPETPSDAEFRSKGYTIDATTRRPIFLYTYKGIHVANKIYPDDEARSITHQISLTELKSTEGLYFKLAEGKIEPLSDGSYSIDQSYYIKPKQRAEIREVNGKKELVVPVQGNEIQYTIIW
jgi:hypothetical protein